MIKANSETMQSIFVMLKNPDEEIKNPIYARVKRTKFFTTASTQYEDGFVASTSGYDLIIVQFDIFGKSQVSRYPLMSLKKVKVTPFIVGTCTIKLTFLIEGKKKKVGFAAAKKVYTTDLDSQEENLEGLIQLFERFAE